MYFGDGAANTGGFHESLNIASLWKLPVVLVCENNGYAEFTPMSEHTVVERLSEHCKPYGIPSHTVDGNDVFDVLAAMEDAVERARSGGGPTMVECLTYRLRGHYIGGPRRTTVKPRKCPNGARRIRCSGCRAHLVEQGTLTEDSVKQLHGGGGIARRGGRRIRACESVPGHRCDDCTGVRVGRDNGGCTLHRRTV